MAGMAATSGAYVDLLDVTVLTAGMMMEAQSRYSRRRSDLHLSSRNFGAAESSVSPIVIFLSVTVGMS